MLIDKDSPLRRFPASSENKQTLFFDGIRYSVEMAALAYARLQQTLYDMTVTINCNPSSSAPIDFVPAIMDAWSIVDSVHRLRMLVKQTPGLKKNAPGVQIFERSTTAIKELRDFVQHLDERTQELVGHNLPIWGALSWVTIPNPESKSAFICTILAGTIFQRMEELLVNPIGKTINIPIDLITLTVNNKSICLSEIIRNVERLTRSMEEALKEPMKDFPPSQGDVLACVTMDFSDASQA